MLTSYHMIFSKMNYKFQCLVNSFNSLFPRYLLDSHYSCDTYLRCVIRQDIIGYAAKTKNAQI